MFLFHSVTPYIGYQIFDSSFGRFLSSAEFKVQMDPISIFYVRYHRTASSVDRYPTNRDVHHERFAHDLCCELQPMEEHASKYVVANHHLFTEFSPKLKEKKNLSSVSAKPYSGPGETHSVHPRGTHILCPSERLGTCSCISHAHYCSAAAFSSLSR